MPLVMLAVWGLNGSQHRALAQDGGEDWAVPVNISQSGGSTNPKIVVSTDTTVHVIWDDAYDAAESARDEVKSSGYARNGAGQWGLPTLVEFPFSGRTSQLLAGNNNSINALWLDDEGSLFYRGVDAAVFNRVESWQGASPLSTLVVKFDAAIDAEGRIHVVFLHAEDSPEYRSGVYYLRSTPGGQSWSPPISLYQSDYFRRFAASGDRAQPTTAEGGVAPHVDIEAAQTDAGTQVYLSWDNPSIKRIFLSRSKDAGVTWESPREIDGPNPDLPYATPRQLTITGIGDRLLLLWQIFETGGSCTQVYQASADHGDTWNGPKTTVGGLNGCLDEIQTFVVNDSVVLFATLQNQAYLLAWNGGEWSLLQSQPSLNKFVDQGTYNFVEYGCRQAGLAGDQIYVVGCDLGEGGDIWATTKPLGEVASWFDPSVGWATEGVVPIEADQILAMTAAGDSQGVVHALWSQVNTNATDSIASDVYYASWGQPGIVGPFEVLSRLPGLASQLSLAIEPEDRLLAVWSGGQTGELAYSWTSASQASAKSSWLAPEPFQSTNAAGRSPETFISPSGKAYAVYAIPLNERRGVYLAQSLDRGQSWSEAVQVFDAAAAGCDMVEQPSLAVTSGEVLHVVWTCATPPGGIGPLALYYSRSIDGGQTWSPPQQMRNRPVIWSRIVGVGSVVHLVWEEYQSGRTSTWQTTSSDGGVTWGEPQDLSVVDGLIGPTSLVIDQSGRLHLLQVTQDGANRPVASYSLWDGEKWLAQESLVLRSEASKEVVALSASMADSRLTAVYAGLGPQDANGVRLNEVVFASIPVEPGTPIIEATPATAPTPAATESAPATIAPAATAALSAEPGLTDVPPAGGNSVIGLLIGGVSALVIVAAVFAIRSRSSRANES